MLERGMNVGAELASDGEKVINRSAASSSSSSSLRLQFVFSL